MDNLIIVDGHLDASLSKQIMDYERAIKTLKDEYDRMKAMILDAMEREGVIKLETNELAITYVGKTDRETLDSKTLKAELPDVYDAYVKISPVKPSIRIKVK
ncbi:MAG: hypothetical protein IJI45_18425 [Anaerolineaceae bacterium]|nr:hypothetical protein [Anaerolineaceae bacterium]